MEIMYRNESLNCKIIHLWFKVKVKLSLCLIKHHAMKVCGVVEI
jgi:hypothetical protein